MNSNEANHECVSAGKGSSRVNTDHHGHIKPVNSLDWSTDAEDQSSSHPTRERRRVAIFLSFVVCGSLLVSGVAGIRLILEKRKAYAGVTASEWHCELDPRSALEFSSETNIPSHYLERDFIRGQTSDCAVWRFDNIEMEKYPDGIPLTLELACFRNPYFGTQWFREPINGDCYGLIEIIVRNPNSHISCTALIAPFSPIESSTHHFWIPRQLSKNSLQETGERELSEFQDSIDLYQEFVEDGSLEIIVRGEDANVYIGFKKEDMRLKYVVLGSENEDWPVPERNSTPHRSNRPLSEKECRETYMTALAACENAWNEYEDAIFPFHNFDGTNFGISPSDELRIALQIDEVLWDSVSVLQSGFGYANNGDIFVYAASLYGLLGCYAEEVRCIERAASVDARYEGLKQFVWAKQKYGNGEYHLVDVYIEEAIRLHPLGSEDRCSEMCEHECVKEVCLHKVLNVNQLCHTHSCALTLG